MVILWYADVYTYIVGCVFGIHLIYMIPHGVTILLPLMYQWTELHHAFGDGKSFCVVKIDVFNGHCHDVDGGEWLFVCMWTSCGYPFLRNFQSPGVIEFAVGEDL